MSHVAELEALADAVVGVLEAETERDGEDAAPLWLRLERQLTLTLPVAQRKVSSIPSSVKPAAAAPKAAPKSPSAASGPMEELRQVRSELKKTRNVLDLTKKKSRLLEYQLGKARKQIDEFDATKEAAMLAKAKQMEDQHLEEMDSMLVMVDTLRDANERLKAQLVDVESEELVEARVSAKMLEGELLRMREEQLPPASTDVACQVDDLVTPDRLLAMQHARRAAEYARQFQVTEERLQDLVGEMTRIKQDRAAVADKGVDGLVDAWTNRVLIARVYASLAEDKRKAGTSGETDAPAPDAPAPDAAEASDDAASPSSPVPPTRPMRAHSLARIREDADAFVVSSQQLSREMDAFALSCHTSNSAFDAHFHRVLAKAREPAHFGGGFESDSEYGGSQFGGSQFGGSRRGRSDSVDTNVDDFADDESIVDGGPAFAPTRVGSSADGRTRYSVDMETGFVTGVDEHAEPDPWLELTAQLIEAQAELAGVRGELEEVTDDRYALAVEVDAELKRLEGELGQTQDELVQQKILVVALQQQLSHVAERQGSPQVLRGGASPPPGELPPAHAALGGDESGLGDDGDDAAVFSSPPPSAVGDDDDVAPSILVSPFKDISAMPIPSASDIAVEQLVHRLDPADGDEAHLNEVIRLRKRLAQTNFKALNAVLGQELSFTQVLNLSNTNLDAIASRARRLMDSAKRQGDFARASHAKGVQAMVHSSALCEQVSLLLMESAALRKQLNDYAEAATSALLAKEAAFRASFGGSSPGGQGSQSPAGDVSATGRSRNQSLSTIGSRTMWDA